jgi:hypothetical protein
MGLKFKFDYTIYLTDSLHTEGMEEVDCTITAVGSYHPGVTSGPPERCYPEESDMEITSITTSIPVSPAVRTWLDGLDGGDVYDDLIETAWVYYHEAASGEAREDHERMRGEYDYYGED